MAKKRNQANVDMPLEAGDRVTMAEKVAAFVEIVDVRLLETQAHVALSRETLPTVVHQSYSTRVVTRDDRKDIAVIVELVLRASYSGKDPEASSAEPCQEGEVPPIEIEAAYLLRYQLEGLRDFSPAEITAFGELNGPYNVWPYWREYVYTMLSRMGLPPLTLPVFRFGEGSGSIAMTGNG